MSDAVYIDGVLKEWGERLFHPPVKGRKGRQAKNIRGGAVKGGSAPKTPTARSVRTRLEHLIRKAPEVMVKISGGGKNMSHIKAHMEYISRNGELELEDESGEIHQGHEGVKDVRDSWAKGRVGIPLTGEKRREAFNIVLSMPPGTNRQSVKDAARQFAAEQFSTHQYVFAAHDDEQHPHVHLTVKAVDRAGVRLNPRKADLQRWREHFADKLREQGIIANATPRWIRGIVKKAEKQAIHHIDTEHKQGKRKEPSRARTGQAKAIIDEVKTGKPHPNPAQRKIIQTRQTIIGAYGEMAKALGGSSDVADKKLALQMVEFVKTMPPLQTRQEQAVEFVKLRQAQINIERNDGDSGGRDR